MIEKSSFSEKAFAEHVKNTSRKQYTKFKFFR